MYLFFFFNDTATTEIYTLSLHDALPIWFQEGFCEGQERHPVSHCQEPRSEEDQALDSERGRHEEELRRDSAERPATEPRIEASGRMADDPLAEPMAPRAGASRRGGFGAEEEARRSEERRVGKECRSRW